MIQFGPTNFFFLFLSTCRSFQTWHNCTFLFGVCSYTFSHSDFIKDFGPQHVILHLNPDEDLPLEERKQNCPKPADFLGIILGKKKKVLKSHKTIEIFCFRCDWRDCRRWSNYNFHVESFDNHPRSQRICPFRTRTNEYEVFCQLQSYFQASHYNHPKPHF